MAADTRWKFIFIVLLTAVCAYVVAPIPNKPKVPGLADAKIVPGIDLAGGAELRYQLLFKEGEGNRAAKTKEATDVIRRRVEGKQAIKEPKINAQGDDQIIVQIPGVDQTGLDDYKRLIGQTGILKLHAVAGKAVQEQFNQDKQVPSGYVTIENAESRRDAGEYAAWAVDRVLLHKDPIIEGRNIIRSEAQQHMGIRGVEWVTSFELDAEGSKRFDEAAKRLYHERPPGMIAIVMNDKLRSMPAVRAETFGGHGQITGARDEKDARELAIVLRSGSLPAEIKLIADSYVGPTQGQDAIRRGFWASGITLALTAIFMLVYYRAAGMVAIISLLLNLAFLLGIMAFFGATMTLPGVAGIVLTVAMAIDANILIFERIREEQQKGKSASQAYEAGHERAFSAIVDSNITTLVAGIVLYYFGTGPIQGFAVTLCLGILTTLFSVLFCAKTFLRMLIVGGLKEFKMLKLMSAPQLEYLKVAGKLVTISLIVCLAGSALTVWRGRDNLGIDFNGGSILAFQMTREMSIEDVRTRIRGVKGADGLPKYPDVDVQTMIDPEKGMKLGAGGGQSNTFQLRTRAQDYQALKNDIQDVFKDTLTHEPYSEMTAKDVELDPKLKQDLDNTRILDGAPAGMGFYIWVLEKATVPALKKKIEDSGSIKDVLRREGSAGLFVLEETPAGVTGLRKLKFLPAKKVSESPGAIQKLKDLVKIELKDDLSPDPFIMTSKIEASVASDLGNSAFWAMAISWALMIVYIAIRFASWRYGVAAVIALVHDTIISIAFVSLAGFLIPKSWGLSFEMNLTTLAAILTIIGYAINDKIVVFDRIRENLILMKKESFTDVINASVNQTMSRTILTGIMVWVASIILYVLTMHTGGGISEFAFPLIIGIIAGTYSTIYIAAPIVLWWYGGKRPETA
jgi:SecD/SecF fusion protein